MIAVYSVSYVFLVTVRTIGFFAYAQNDRIDNRYSVAPLLTLRMTRLNYA